MSIVLVRYFPKCVPWTEGVSRGKARDSVRKLCESVVWMGRYFMDQAK